MALSCRWSSRPQHQKRTWWACRTLSVKTLNVDARQGGIASRGGRDADRVDCVRHSAVGVFPHVHHHRGDRLAYPADPEKRERALLAPLNAGRAMQCISLLLFGLTSSIPSHLASAS